MTGRSRLYNDRPVEIQGLTEVVKEDIGKLTQYVSFKNATLPAAAKWPLFPHPAPFSNAATAAGHLQLFYTLLFTMLFTVFVDTMLSIHFQCYLQLSIQCYLQCYLQCYRYNVLCSVICNAVWSIVFTALSAESPATAVSAVVRLCASLAVLCLTSSSCHAHYFTSHKRVTNCMRLCVLFAK